MKISKKQFEEFKDEFLYWVDVFGLKGWEIVFEFGSKHLLDVSENEAEVLIHVKSRQAFVTLRDDVSDPNIRKTALHEACELLLGKISNLAEERFATADALDEARHEVIHILDKLLFNNKELKKE